MKVAFALLAATAFALGEVDDKNRPVTKVISLLKDMKKQLETEQDGDQSVYDKMACWCETNRKEKTQAIKDAEARIAELETKIENMDAKSVRLNAEIKNHEKEVAANQAALDQATAIRQKELASFSAEEKDLLESISALKAAIVVLSKHQTFLQVPRSHMLGVAATLQHELQKHADLFVGVLSPSERRAIAAFVQAPEEKNFLGKTPKFNTQYNTQSSQIFGILRQMQDTFEQNLSAAQKEELAKQKQFADLKAAKSAEITSGQAQIDSKTEELANADEAAAQAKQDIEDTKKSLSADEQFMMMLEEKCKATDAEWAERQKTRQGELAAVSKALEILSSDDAKDTFSKTFNPSFMQLTGGASAQQRRKASQLLTATAERLQQPRLATLAVEVRLDAFVKVKEAIDNMVKNLLAEKANEVKKKDYCNGKFNEVQLSTEDATRSHNEKEAAAASLESQIAQLAEELEAAATEVTELQTQMKRAGEDREKENKEFQGIISEQREAQRLLTGAIAALNAYYEKKPAALVQQGPAPPEGFKTYKDNAQSGGVIGMLQQIQNDAKSMEAETLRNEEDAQKAYESIVKSTNKAVDAKNRQIVEQTEAKSKADGKFVETKKDLKRLGTELERLSNEDADLHLECDFVLKNFEVRQTARDEEVEALRQVKAILSGADFQAAIASA